MGLLLFVPIRVKSRVAIAMVHNANRSTLEARSKQPTKVLSPKFKIQALS